MDFSPEILRTRFAELTGKHDAIHAAADPLRQSRDKIVQTAAKAEQALNDKIAVAEAGLFEIEQERAVLARALGGQTATGE